MSQCVSYLHVIGRVPVDVIQHQVGSPDQIKPHPACFGAQQKQEVQRVRTVKPVDQPLPLAGGGVSVQSAEGVAHVNTQVLQHVKCLSIVGHYDHPAGAHTLCQYIWTKVHTYKCKHPHTHLSVGLSCLMTLSKSDSTRSFPESAVLSPPEE